MGSAADGEAMTSVSPVKQCAKCAVNPRRSERQRWCSNCHREYQREWKAEQTQNAQALREMLERIAKHAKPRKVA